MIGNIVLFIGGKDLLALQILPFYPIEQVRLAAIFDIVYASNTALSNENKNAKAVVEKTLDLIHELGGVLGLFQKTQEKSIDAEVEELIEKRNKARSEKNWAEADAIRDKLKAMNIELKDTPMGVKWNYISE